MENETKINYKTFKRCSVIDAEDYPWPVGQERSDLEESSILKNYLANNYPQLICGSPCVVDGNVIIQDMMIARQKVPNDLLNLWARGLNVSSSRTMQVIDSLKATYTLRNIIRNKINSSLCVFIGGSGEDVRDYLIASRCDMPKSIVAKPKKVVTKSGLVTSGVVLEDTTICPSNVIVFDDVVASGNTAIEVGLELRKKYGDIPMSFATWVMVSPDNDTPSGLPLYDQVYSSYVLKGNGVKRPPINSLSTLIEDTCIQQDYAQKYAYDYNTFIGQLKTIGGEI